jgi:hypothetical protein
MPETTHITEQFSGIPPSWPVHSHTARRTTHVACKPKPPRHPGRGSIRARTCAAGRSGRCPACHIRNDLKTGEDNWHLPALANAARALLAMPDEALPPFVSIVPDLDLLNAATEMQEADATIERLHRRHGDHADGRGDYQEVEAKRHNALDILAGESARSWNGMVAKAQALSDRRLIEDFARHGEIATSLAADVLRHFGARLA